MELKGFEVTGLDGSVKVCDGDFSVGVDFGEDVDIQLLVSDEERPGKVVLGFEDLDFDSDFELIESGVMIDVFGVAVKGFEESSRSFWFEMDSTSFYFSESPGVGDIEWLEGNVDVAFLRPDEGFVLEVVRMRPEMIVVVGGGEAERSEFAAELRDRSFDVRKL